MTVSILLSLFYIIVNQMETLNKNNIFAIPVGEEFSCESSACYLVYAPLANVFFLALPQEVENISKAIENGERNSITDALLKKRDPGQLNPYGYGYSAASTLYLLPNEKCNFHCKYCYSAKGRSKEEMSFEVMKKAIDYFMDPCRKASKVRNISFFGGGEPTLSWELVIKGTEYAEKLALENNIEIQFCISTNGSVLTEEMIEFYKKHRFQIQVSFEVLKEIQELQRGSYDIVDRNIKRLLEEKINCIIRSTITIENVDLIPQMVEHCHINYPAVGALGCSPVVDPDFFSSVEIVREFQDRYFDSFMKGLQLADKYNIRLNPNNENYIRLIRERHCYNLLCVTPFGTITTCTDISSPKEEGYDEAVFGTIDGANIKFDDEVYDRLTPNMIHIDEKCKSCWAKWNCGGGCPNQRRVYSEDVFHAVCEHNKKILRHYLLLELREKYHKRTGQDLYKDISKKLR